MTFNGDCLLHLPSYQMMNAVYSDMSLKIYEPQETKNIRIFFSLFFEQDDELRLFQTIADFAASPGNAINMFVVNHFTP